MRLFYTKIHWILAVTSPSNEAIYFVAPDRFLGDQRASYNHDLKFTLFTEENSAYTPSTDLILEGAGTYISIPVISQRNVAPSGKVLFVNNNFLHIYMPKHLRFLLIFFISHNGAHSVFQFILFFTWYIFQLCVTFLYYVNRRTQAISFHTVCVL